MKKRHGNLPFDIAVLRLQGSKVFKDGNSTRSSKLEMLQPSATKRRSLAQLNMYMLGQLSQIRIFTEWFWLGGADTSMELLQAMFRAFFFEKKKKHIQLQESGPMQHVKMHV